MEQDDGWVYQGPPDWLSSFWLILNDYKKTKTNTENHKTKLKLENPVWKQPENKMNWKQKVKMK